MNNLSLKDFQSFIDKHGRRGKEEIEILNKMIPHLEAVVFNSPGKDILMEDEARCAVLMIKLYNDELTADERIELKYLKNRLARIANLLHTFQDKQNKIVESIKNNA